MRLILFVVQELNQGVVLRFRGFKSKRINPAFVGCTNKLRPAATPEAAPRYVLSQVCQVRFIIFVAQPGNGSAVHMRRHYRVVFDGIQVRN